MSRLLAFLALIAFCCGLGFAQTETASLTGRVTDPSGAVVPGATVTLTNNETKVSTDTKTNSTGGYTFPNVAPGPYQLRVAAPGFKEYVAQRVVLHVQDRVSQDVSLDVGSAEQSVTVSAESVPINTQDASVGTVVERQEIENTPLNGRTFQSLITLAPGVATVAASAGSSGQFVVNGQRSDTSYFTVDGVSANAAAAGSGSLGVNGTGNGVTQSATGGYNNVVSVDAIQEFKISTSTFAPEYGRTPGGQISVVTKGGTGAFHGEGFDFLRNTVLDANDWFLNAAGKPRNTFGRVNQNDFGGTFSGPIKREKLFFFLSYEGLRLKAPKPTVVQVPTANARTLAAQANDNGAAGWMAQFLNAYPLPDNNLNPACTTLATCEQPYTAADPIGSRLDAGSARIDYNLNKKTQIFGRYSNAPSYLSTASSVTVSAFNLGTQSYTAGLTRSFSDRIINDARFNYTHTSLVQSQTTPLYKGDLTTVFPSGFAQPPASFVTNGSAVANTMAIQIRPAGMDGLLLSPQQGDSWQYQKNFTDTLSWIHGNHGLKFGADYRQLSPEWNQASFNQNNTFAANATVQGSPANVCPTGVLPAGSPATIPGFICGQATLSNLQHNYPQSFVFHQYSFFGQDSWKATRRLTVTYGARWEINPPFGFTNGHAGFSVQQSTFNLGNFSTLTLNPLGTAPYSTKWNRVAPRLGLAYQVSDSQNWGSVIRAGYGIFYDTGAQTGTLLATPWNTRVNNIGSGEPTSAFILYPFTNTSNCATTAWNGSLTAKQASCAAYAAPVAANTTPPVSNGGMDAIIDPNFTLPYVQQMNVTFEQKLGVPQSISLSYVGAMGRKLIGQLGFPSASGNVNVFSLNGIPDAINVFGNYANSSYNAFQTKFQREFVRGFAFVASYAWSHSLDNSSNNGTAGTLFLPTINQATTGAPQALLRGDSDFDIRHNLAVSVVYNVPTPFKSNALSRAILGGWWFDPIYHYQTAVPVDIQTGINGTIGGTSFGARPNVIPGVPIYVSGSTCQQQYAALFGYSACLGGQALNLAPVSASQAASAGCVTPTGGTFTGTNGYTIAGKTANAKGAFCTPANVSVNGVLTPISGNLGRNTVRAFPLAELDFSVHRDIAIYERLHVRFQADMFNVLNHPVFGPYNSATVSLNGQTFGTTSALANSWAGNQLGNASGVNPIFATGAPRNAQFGLKVIF